MSGRKSFRGPAGEEMQTVNRFSDIVELHWEPVRPDVAREVYGKPLLDEGVKLVLTRVAPGGRFSPHRDPCGHLFYFLAGEGTVHVEGETVPARPGLAVRVAPGQEHAYENTGTSDLLLLSANIPPN